MGEKLLRNEDTLQPDAAFYTPMGDKDERGERASLTTRTNACVSLTHLPEGVIVVYFY